MSKIKFVVFMLCLMVVLSSKKCNNGGTNNTPQNYITASVDLTNTWIAQYPQAYTCGGSGPTFGNRPSLNAGTCSFYTETNKRFTEVIVRRISDNSEFDKKCWGPGSIYNLNVKIPSTGAFEIKFKQYDGCTTTCMTVCNSSGCKGVRLIWEVSKTYTGPTTIITLAPVHNPSTGYTVCS